MKYNIIVYNGFGTGEISCLSVHYCAVNQYARRKEMIDEEATFEKYGYYSTDLKPQSNKHVVAVCDDCRAIRYPTKHDYNDLCKSCAHIGIKASDETRANMSIGQKKSYAEDPSRSERSSLATKKAHENDPTLRDRLSIATKKAYADDPTLIIRMAITRKKAHAADPTIAERMSASHQGIPYEEWKGFVANGPYCEKFDEACRERIRAKYGCRCFLCDKPQNENVAKNGKQKKLSVHHYDMNKNAGCDDTEFKLVPLCMHCHGITHTPMWTARIEYLLRSVWKI